MYKSINDGHEIKCRRPIVISDIKSPKYFPLKEIVVSLLISFILSIVTSISNIEGEL